MLRQLPHRYSLYGIRYIEALFKMSNCDLDSNCLTVWLYTFKLETIVNFGKELAKPAIIITSMQIAQLLICL